MKKTTTTTTKKKKKNGEEEEHEDQEDDDETNETIVKYRKSKSPFNFLSFSSYFLFLLFLSSSPPPTSSPSSLCSSLLLLFFLSSPKKLVAGHQLTAVAVVNAKGELVGNLSARDFLGIAPVETELLLMDVAGFLAKVSPRSLQPATCSSDITLYEAGTIFLFKETVKKTKRNRIGIG